MRSSLNGSIKSCFCPEMQAILSVLVCFGLVSSLALPPVPLYGLDVYLVTIFSPLVGILVFTAWSVAPVFHFSSLFPVALGLLVCVSSIFSWYFQFSSINHRDIVESIKYFQFFPYLLAIPFLSEKTLAIFHRGLIIASICVGFIGFLQVFRLGEMLSILYLGPESAHLEPLILGRRITLTGSDPNVGGVISAFFCVYFFSVYAVERKLLYLVGFLGFMFLCFSTQSRTALLALIFGLSVYYLVFFRAFIFYKIFFLVFGVCLVLFLIIFLDLSYVYLGFQHALEGRNNSLNVRVENVLDAYHRFLESPLLGVGPAKSSFSTIIDSEYALIIQRYGLVGFLLFFGYLMYLLKLAYSEVFNAWGVCLLIFTLMALLVMLTNNIFSGYQLMSIVVILSMACILSQRARKPRTQDI